MINKLTTWFYRSIFGEWYLNYLLTRSSKQAEKDINNLFISDFDSETADIIQDSQQYKYQESILHLKKLVNERAKTKSYDEVLKEIDNLFSLVTTPNTTEAKIKAIIYSRAVGKTTDVKTEKDKVEMVDKRINDYYELQKHVLERQKRRLERKSGKK
jgi:hypothetical protein